MTQLYRPLRGRSVPMPGGQHDWPEEGRAIDPNSAYETRLVLDGDLVPVLDDKAEPKNGKTP